MGLVQCVPAGGLPEADFVNNPDVLTFALLLPEHLKGACSIFMLHLNKVLSGKYFSLINATSA